MKYDGIKSDRALLHDVYQENKTMEKYVKSLELQNEAMKKLILELNQYPDIPNELDPDTAEKWNNVMTIIGG